MTNNCKSAKEEQTAIRFSMSQSTILFSLGKSLGVVIERVVLSLTFNLLDAVEVEASFSAYC